MFFHVKVYYEECPECGQTWSERVVQHTSEIRVGKEVFVCKCGIEHPTGNIEWAHLDSRQRKSYFFGSAEIGTVAIATFMPGLFGYFIGDYGLRSALAAASWGFLVGLAFAGFLWSVRMVNVKLSLSRCPRNDPGFVSGAVPWEW